MSFGDVSKCVASMWDALDPDSKAMYKKRTEMAKKEYLRQLASYRATLVVVSQGTGIQAWAAWVSDRTSHRIHRARHNHTREST